MMQTLMLASFLLVSGARSVEVPRAQILNLSCVEALAAVDAADLAGVFSFVPEKDAPAAFADYLVHNRKAMKKYLAKVGKDRKAASGVSAWDHEALQFALAIYTSPLAETLEKPAAGIVAQITELTGAPVLTLEEMSMRRGK